MKLSCGPDSNTALPEWVPGPVQVTSGPVWLPRSSASWSRSQQQDGAYRLVIERWQILGRLGWQRVSETIPVQPG